MRYVPLKGREVPFCPSDESRSGLWNERTL